MRNVWRVILSTRTSSGFCPPQSANRCAWHRSMRPAMRSCPTDPRCLRLRLRPACGDRTVRRRATQGRFESRPLPSCRAIGRLQFQVSGYLGMPNHSLAVKDLRSGREVAVRPSTIPRESWRSVSVPCPAGPFSIVAVDAAPDSWFAFREPVEVGWASLWTEWLIARSRALLLISLSLAVLAIRWSGQESYGKTASTPEHG